MVVDASVLVSALVDTGGNAAWAEAAVADEPLAGPELALAEAGNILRRLERAGIISRIQAANAHQDLLDLDIDLFPFRPFAERV